MRAVAEVQQPADRVFRDPELLGQLDLGPAMSTHGFVNTALQHLFLEPGQRADHVIGKLASQNRAQRATSRSRGVRSSRAISESCNVTGMCNWNSICPWTEQSRLLAS